MANAHLSDKDEEVKCIVGNTGSGTSVRLPKGVFGYYGSKQRLANSILKHLPPHNCWVELFGGALAVTLAKQPADLEIVNDLDDNIVNAFRQIRDHLDDLTGLIEHTPYARSELLKARQSCEEDSDLERARKFLVQAMMSVNGVIAGKRGGFSISNSYARNFREARVNRWLNYPDRLRAVTQRLREIRIENKDAIELLAEYSNRPATLVYIDPPYLAERGLGYNVEAGDRDFHQRLLSQALLCNCMIMISGYNSDTYIKLLEERGGWHRVELNAATQTTKGDRLDRQEVLWMNQPAVTGRESGKMGVRLTKKGT